MFWRMHLHLKLRKYFLKELSTRHRDRDEIDYKRRAETTATLFESTQENKYEI